jgi:hypothetical protein
MDDDRTPRERPESDDDSTPQELTARYLTGPALLRDTVAGMDAHQLHARPIPGKMSTQEVVTHIVDSERSMSERMRRTIAGEEPIAMGGAGHPGPPHHPERDVAADVEALGTIREQMAEDLRSLAPEVWGRIALRREGRVLTL